MIINQICLIVKFDYIYKNYIIIGRNFENQRWAHGAGGAGDGGGSGGGRGWKLCCAARFSRSLAVDQARMPRISAFFAVVGKTRTFFHD